MENFHFAYATRSNGYGRPIINDDKPYHNPNDPDCKKTYSEDGSSIFITKRIWNDLSTNIYTDIYWINK